MLNHDTTESFRGNVKTVSPMPSVLSTPTLRTKRRRAQAHRELDNRELDKLPVATHNGNDCAAADKHPGTSGRGRVPSPIRTG